MRLRLLLCCCWLLGCAGPPPSYHARLLAEEGHPVALQAVNGRYLRLDANGILVADAATLAEADTLIWRDMGDHIFALQVGGRFLRAYGHYNYAVEAKAEAASFGARFMWYEENNQTYLKSSSNHYIGLSDDGVRMIVQHSYPLWNSPIRRIDL